MFKLPALKPYGEARETRPRLVPTLESTDDFKTSPMKQKWSSGGRSSRRPAEQGADFNPPIKTRTWENQADEVMSQGSTTEKFRSLAVYAEMKLQEALEKCNEITPAHQRDEEAPDRFRAACCLQIFDCIMKRALAILPPKPIKMFEPRAVQLLCADAAPSGFRPLTSLLKALYPQSPEGNRPRNPSFLQQLLGELCAFVGPFEHILGRIRDELALSIYSEYYSSQGGDLAFDQIPWFVVVEKLENEKRVLLADREKFTAALLEHQEAMTRVEAQVTMLQKKVQDAEAAAKAASQKLELISEKEKKAVMEAGGAKEELKRTRKELMKIKDELRKRTEEAAAARAEAEETESALRLRMEHLKREAADARAEAERAEHLRNELVPKSLVEAAEDTVKELRLEIKKYEERADEARLDRIREIMTPRVNWKALDPFGEGEPAPGTSSKEIIKRMVKRLKKQEEGMPSKKELEELKEAAAQLDDAKALAEATSALLAPEPPMIPLDWVHLQRNIAEGYAPVIRVTGFGKGPEVPRYLRCDGEINFPEMSMAEAEAQVSALWRAKRESDSITGRLLHVGDYMYSWARKVAGSQEPRRAVHAAYRLLVSCCTHASKSPQIRLFLEVLSGRVGEAAMEDMPSCVAGIAKLLRMLAGLGRGKGTFQLTEEATDLITREDLQSAIENYFPMKGEEKAKELLAAAEADSPAGEDGDERIKVASILNAGGGTAASSFLKTLQDQYIEEVVAYSGQIKAAVKSLMPKDADDGAREPRQVDLNGARMALATMDSSFTERDVSNLLATGAGLAFGSLADAVSSGGGARVDAGVFTARLQGMLVRPSKLWDTEGALEWCRELRDGKPERGCASQGGQPEMA